MDLREAVELDLASAGVAVVFEIFGEIDRSHAPRAQLALDPIPI